MGWSGLAANAAFSPTPLWPAGHLPRKEGDWQLRHLRLFWCVEDLRRRQPHLISPLAGEMSGRTEGGVTERNLRAFQQSVICGN
ncbi:hypothetical protein X753_27035 [Mesorhizobium sp. LNJC399B00]|nr:hypothetical protein X753_27035 [Mesorhizobium sp. LNJC399B00]